jgi:FtsZ-interacting cell division protein ZipA
MAQRGRLEKATQTTPDRQLGPSKIAARLNRMVKRKPRSMVRKSITLYVKKRPGKEFPGPHLFSANLASGFRLQD